MTFPIDLACIGYKKCISEGQYIQINPQGEVISLSELSQK